MLRLARADEPRGQRRHRLARPQNAGGTWSDRFIDELGRRQVVGSTASTCARTSGSAVADLSRWVNDPLSAIAACALAVEFKKVFMDEWTGESDLRHLAELRRAIEAVVHLQSSMNSGALSS